MRNCVQLDQCHFNEKNSQQSEVLFWLGLQRTEACSDIEIFNLSPTLPPNLAPTQWMALLFCNPQYLIPDILIQRISSSNIHNMTCIFRYSQIAGLVSWVDPLTRCSCQRDVRPCITTTQLWELCFRSEIVWLSLVYYSTLSLSVDVDTDNQYKEPMVNSNII